MIEQAYSAQWAFCDRHTQTDGHTQSVATMSISDIVTCTCCLLFLGVSEASCSKSANRLIAWYVYVCRQFIFLSKAPQIWRTLYGRWWPTWCQPQASWTGHNNKQAFKNLQLKKVVLCKFIQTIICVFDFLEHLLQVNFPLVFFKSPIRNTCTLIKDPGLIKILNGFTI